MDFDGIIIKNTKDLPHEVATDILSRLPVQHLFKFKCISKTWLQSLTQDPHFAKLHSDRSIRSNKLNPEFNSSILVERKNSLLIAIDYTASDIVIELGFPFHAVKRYKYNLSGVCNGLLCYSCSDKNVYIWNPLINDYITISCSGFTKKATRFAFGYDPCRNEYKVVGVSCTSEFRQQTFHTQISVYTLGMNSWRIVEEDFQWNLYSGTNNVPLLVNGVLHWFAQRTGASYDKIVGFDVKDEVLREMLLPSEIDFSDISSLHEIGELHGLLSIFTRVHYVYVEIWQMKEYGDSNSWNRLLRVARSEGLSKLFYLEALRVAQNGEDILKLNSLEVPLSNPETKMIMKIKKRFAGLEDCHTHTYVGSIISPRVIGGVAHNMTGKKNGRSMKRKRVCDGSIKSQDL